MKMIFKNTNSKCNRDARYELIRVVAMFFVIALHNIGSMSSGTDRRMFYQYFFNLLFFTSNGIFYMLSGKFAMMFDKSKPGAYKKYYCKKVINFIVPMLVYMFARTVVDTGINVGIKGIIKIYIINVLSGYWSSEYWFLYVLLGNILIAPLLAYGFNKMTDKELWLFLGLGILYNMLCAYLPLLGYEFAWSYPFGSYTFYFYMGYCIDRLIKNRRQSAKFIVFGIICFIVSIMQNYWGKTSGLYDIAPTFTFICIGMFFLLRDFIKVKSEISKRIIFFIGKYSFSVYLIHSVVLNKVVKKAYPFKPDMMFLPYLFIIAVITMIVCIAICFVTDNTVIRFIKNILNRFCKKYVYKEGESRA